jgi:hypothetical protein
VDANSVEAYRNLIPKEVLIAWHILGGELDFCYRDAQMNPSKTAGQTDVALTFQVSFKAKDWNNPLVVSKQRVIISAPNKLKAEGVWGVVAHFSDATRPFDRAIKAGQTEEVLPPTDRNSRLGFIASQVESVQFQVRNEVLDTLNEDLGRKHSKLGQHLESVVGAKIHIQALLMDALGSSFESNELRAHAQRLPSREELLQDLLSDTADATLTRTQIAVRNFINVAARLNAQRNLTSDFTKYESELFKLLKEYIALVTETGCGVSFETLPLAIKESLIRSRDGLAAATHLESDIDSLVAQKKSKLPTAPILSDQEKQESVAEKNELEQRRRATAEATKALNGTITTGDAHFHAADAWYNFTRLAIDNGIAKPESIAENIQDNIQLHGRINAVIPGFSRESFINLKLGDRSLTPDLQEHLISYLEKYKAYRGNPELEVPDRAFEELAADKFFKYDNVQKLALLKVEIRHFDNLLAIAKSQGLSHHQVRLKVFKVRSEIISDITSKTFARYERLVDAMNKTGSKLGYEQAIIAEKYVTQLGKLREKVLAEEVQAVDQLRAAEKTPSLAARMEIRKALIKQDLSNGTTQASPQVGESGELIKTKGSEFAFVWHKNSPAPEGDGNVHTTEEQTIYLANELPDLMGKMHAEMSLLERSSRNDIAAWEEATRKRNIHKRDHL